MEIIIYKDVMNAENTMFEYTSVPPPPYTKSSIESSYPLNIINKVFFFQVQKDQ